MEINGIIISDIHYGIKTTEYLNNELNNVFFTYLHKLKKIDFICITGDFFDRKLYANEIAIKYAILFMDNLVKIAIKHKCPIRIVYGTESHEVNQYEIFSTYENSEEVDFKVIKNVSEEELLKDLNVLYIPETYVVDKDEYYEDYFKEDNKYDLVFGHGIIQEAMTEAVRHLEKSKSDKRKKAPVFKSSELSRICKGKVFFGHYHKPTNIEDKVFYVGSFSRWKFDEEEDKGFYHIIKKKNKYELNFIVNSLAKKYNTYSYGYNSKIMSDENELIDELNRIDSLIKLKNIDYVRYIFNIPDDYPNPEFIINLLNEKYKYDDNIKVKLVNGYVEKKKMLNKEKLNNTMREYDMIFDKSLELESKISYFIKKKWNIEIDKEKIKNHLYDDLK